MKTTRTSIYPTWLLLTWLSAALLAVAALGSARAQAPRNHSSAAPQSSAYKPAAAAAPARTSEEKEGEEAPVSKDPAHEGIKLHGHWIIDVKNADGTLASHHDFQNAITLDGKMFLLSLLNGSDVPGDYIIEFTNSNGNSPCVSIANTCGIVRTTATYPGVSYCGDQTNDYCATTLTRALAFSGNSATLTFAGSITANQAGSINTVSLSLATCGPIPASSTLNSTSPAACQGAQGPLRSLTGTNPAAISVNNTQIIQVTIVVTLS